MQDSNRRERIMAELYDKISSEFYDYHAKRDDIQFFTEFALDSGGPVLELGCGTGRVLIPTARAGISITGLDKSIEMLDICREKVDKEPAEVRERIHLVNADMQDFELNSQFPLVTITFGPFNNLITVKQQMSCLKSIHRHLKENGRIVFDVYYITLKELSAPEGSLIVPPHPPFEMPDVRKVSWGIMRRGVIDYNQQTMQDGLFYDIEYPDGRKERLVYTDPLRYYYPFEVEHLLARCGFQTEATYADFKKTPFGSQYPSELIFVARKV